MLPYPPTRQALAIPIISASSGGITLTTANPTPHPLALIAADMQAVDQVIAQRLTTSVPLIGQISQYIIAAGGKRLRPALLLMVSNALGDTNPHKHVLASVVELIHTATLLHDDVVEDRKSVV